MHSKQVESARHLLSSDLFKFEGGKTPPTIQLEKRWKNLLEEPRRRDPSPRTDRYATTQTN